MALPSLKFPKIKKEPAVFGLVPVKEPSVPFSAIETETIKEPTEPVITRVATQFGEIQAPVIKYHLLQIPKAFYTGVRMIAEGLEAERETGILGFGAPLPKTEFEKKVGEGLKNLIFQPLAEKATEIVEGLEERQRKVVESIFDEKPGLSNIKEYLFTIESGAISLLEAIGITATTKSSSAGAFFLTAVESSDEYNQARDAGLSPKEASKVAIKSGAGTFLLEKIGLDYYLGMTGANRVWDAVKLAGFETGQENLQTVWQNYVRREGYAPAQKLMEGWWETSVATLLPSFVVGLVLPGVKVQTESAMIKRMSQDAGVSEEVARGAIGEIKNVIEGLRSPIRPGLTIEEVGIPKELEPLAKEARKYKSAEEFVGSFKTSDEIAKLGNDVPKESQNFLFKLETKSIDDLIQTDFVQLYEWKTEYGKDLMRAIKEKEKLPPIVIKEDGTILDGNHRFEAYRRAGVKNVPVATEIKQTKQQLTDIFNQAIKEIKPEVKPEIEIKEKIEEAEANIWVELDVAEAGQRLAIPSEEIGVDYEFLAQRSTFPEWIPEHLRTKPLVDKVMDFIMRQEKPVSGKVRELYDVVIGQVSKRAGVSIEQMKELGFDKPTEITSKIKKELEKRVRVLIKEAKVPGIPVKKVVREITGVAKPVEVREFKQRMTDLVRGLREGRITTKAEIKEVQTILLDALDKTELTANDKKKFSREIKNVQTKEQLTKEFPKFQERIERLLEAQETRTLKSQIARELKDIKPKKVAGKPVGKFTPEVQNVLDSAREAIKLNQKQSDDKLVENLNLYKEKSMPLEIAIQNRILTMNSQGTEGLKDILSIIKEMKDTGRIAKLLQEFNLHEEWDRKKNYLVDIVTDYKGVAEARQTTGVSVKGFKERSKQSLKTLGQNFVLSWRGLMETLDWHSPVDQKTLANRYSVLDQENRYKELQEEYTEDFNKMFADIYNIPTKTRKDKISLPFKVNSQIINLTEEVNLGTFTNTIGQKAEIKMTRDEMVKRYMEFQDPTLVDSFREGNNFTEEIKDAIRGELTNNEKILAERQLEIYKEQYDKVNPIYRKMHGIDLPFNEFYSPIMREGYKLDLKDGFQTFLDEASIRKAVTSKSFITRMKNALPIARQGSLNALDRHITQTNYFIAWAEKVREFDNIFSDATVRDVIKEEFGSSMMKQVMENIEDFGYNRRIRGQIHKSVNWFRKKFTLGALMLKPALVAKQMVSTVAYLEHLSAIDFTAGVVNFWRHPIRNYRIMAKESTFIRTRGKQGEIERDIKAALRSDVYGRFKILHNFWNISMMNIRMGDKGAIITGAWAMRRAGLKRDKSLENTIREYEEFSSETQQSADISRLSAVQKEGSLGVLFTMFKSSQRQYLQKEVNAVKSLFQKRGTSPQNIKKVARILAIYHFLLPMIFQYIANFGGWDEEDRKEYIRAGILGSLNGWFIAGDAVDSIIRAALNLKIWPQEIPIVSLGSDLQQAVKQIDLDNISVEDVKDALFELGDAANALGIPADYIQNFYKGIIELLNENIKQGIGLLGGWSEYALRKPKAKVPPGIKTEGIKFPSLKFPTIEGMMPSLMFPELNIK